MGFSQSCFGQSDRDIDNDLITNFLYDNGEFPLNQMNFLLKTCQQKPQQNVQYFAKAKHSQKLFYREIYILERIKDSIDYIQDYYVDFNNMVIYLPLLTYKDYKLSSNFFSKSSLSELVTVVEALHKKGVVHGDIHPKNIAFWKDKAVITDFDASSPVDTYWNYSHGTQGYSYTTRGFSNF